MQRLSIFDFYSLGHELHALSQWDDNVALQQVFIDLGNAQKWLTLLLSGKLYELSYSRFDAQALLDCVRELSAKYLRFSRERSPEVSGIWAETKLQTPDILRLKNQLETFEYSFAAELREGAAYAIPRMGIFDTGRLVDAAERHLPDELRRAVPPQAERELRDAGRALAFGLSTASGFHAIRAVEAMLAAYHDSFIATHAGAEPGTLVAALSALPDDGARHPNPRTLRLLRDALAAERNPLLQPRESLPPEDAMTLFNLAASAISAMARELAADR